MFTTHNTKANAAPAEIFHCPVEYPATRWDPSEGCEEEVDNEGDLCPKHEAENEEPDWDAIRDDERLGL